MRGIRLLRGVLLAALLAVALPAHAEDPQGLAAFAGRSGLHDIEPFVETVQKLRSTGALPPRYVTKREANAHGWHGGGLCTIWPGHAIGGDALRDFGARLGADRSLTYYEADLDSTCDGRGPKRLIFSRGGSMFITTDHYRTFVEIP